MRRCNVDCSRGLTFFWMFLDPTWTELARSLKYSLLLRSNSLHHLTCAYNHALTSHRCSPETRATVWAFTSATSNESWSWQRRTRQACVLDIWSCSRPSWRLKNWIFRWNETRITSWSTSLRTDTLSTRSLTATTNKGRVQSVYIVFFLILINVMIPLQNQASDWRRWRQSGDDVTLWFPGVMRGRQE